jgi:RimJ/RimL family protein N-acetyltransferase
MSLPLVHGPELTAELAAWAAARIPHVGDAGFGPCWAVGVARDGALAAVVVFHDYQAGHGTVQLSCAADTPRWASREVVGAILGAAFNGAWWKVRKVWAATASTNARAVRFNQGIGMKQEAILRHHYAQGVHSVICSMMEAEYRRRYEGVK